MNVGTENTEARNIKWTAGFIIMILRFLKMIRLDLNCEKGIKADISIPPDRLNS